MSVYESLLRSARTFRRLGAGMAAFGLVGITLVAVTGQPEGARYGLFVLFVLGLYALGLSEFQRRLAQMQAALDMKGIHLRATEGVSSFLQGRAGSEYEIAPRGGRKNVRIRLHTDARIEVLG